jgi:hypothetical protein
VDKRNRSPNYPAMSLPAAIEKAAALYRTIQAHAAPREVIAKGMGYQSLNGASATMISALNKYGLLERVGDEMKVSERALRILHPHSPEERIQAIREAASDPALFVELAQRFPGTLPNEDLLRNYLVRNGFTQAASSSVILAYRETSELVEREERAHDSGAIHNAEAHMQASSSVQANANVIRKQQEIQDGMRLLGRFDFEGGRFVKIEAFGEIDTEEALDMIEEIISLKRKSLAREKAKSSQGILMGKEPEKNSGA